MARSATAHQAGGAITVSAKDRFISTAIRIQPIVDTGLTDGNEASSAVDRPRTEQHHVWSVRQSFTTSLRPAVRNQFNNTFIV